MHSKELQMERILFSFAFTFVFYFDHIGIIKHGALTSIELDSKSFYMFEIKISFTRMFKILDGIKFHPSKYPTTLQLLYITYKKDQLEYCKG